MTNKKELEPTESELEILQVLWSKGSATVREVNEELNKKREVGYTTTLKIMQIMTEKNLVNRDTQSRTHIYHPSVKENTTQKNLLQKFIDKTYRGSAMQMVMQALGHQNASEEELEELKKLIEDIEKNKSEQ
jgi:predicted transcriptional regulator